MDVKMVSKMDAKTATKLGAKTASKLGAKMASKLSYLIPTTGCLRSPHPVRHSSVVRVWIRILGECLQGVLTHP